MRTRWRPLVSAVALGLVLGVLLTPIGMAHLDLVPDVCDRPPAPAQTGVDTDVAVLRGAQSLDLHQHCFTCHWLQSLRSSLLASGVAVLDADSVCAVIPDSACGTRTVARHSLPARAPPSSDTPRCS